MKLKLKEKYRQQDRKALTKTLVGLEEELVKLRLDIKAGKEKDIKKARKKRLEIAVVKTILREQELTEINIKPKTQKQEKAK